MPRSLRGADNGVALPESARRLDENNAKKSRRRVRAWPLGHEML
jgi:hypothetical protein